MSKIYVQSFPEILKYSGALGAGASVSGSLPCAGYSQLVGFLTSSGSSETGSGLSIKQSVDGGANWDINSGSNAGVTPFTSSCMIDVIGNAVKVRYCNGATTSACVRMLFQLKPVAGTAKMPDVDVDVISSGSVTVTSGSVAVTSGSIDTIKGGSIIVTSGCLDAVKTGSFTMTSGSLDIVKSGSVTVISGSTVLNAGEAHVGEFGGKITTSTASFQRTNNASAYTALDAVSDGTTGEVATGLIFQNVARGNEGTGYITKVRAFSSASAETHRFRMHFYNASPTAILDGSPFTLSYALRASRIGYVDLPAFSTEGTGSSAANTLQVSGDGKLPLPFVCAAASNSLYSLVETLDAYTPVAAASYWFSIDADVN